MSDTRPRIVFVTLSDDVGSERIVSEMGRQGAACAVLGRPGCIASLCRDVVHYRLPGYAGTWAAAVAVPRRLEALVADRHFDAIVPIDDLSAQLLRDLATAKRTSPELRKLLTISLGDPAHYRTVCSRSRLLELAATLGIRTPGQRSVADLQAAAVATAELGYPVLLKREQTCGGRGVTLVEGGSALPRAFRAANRRAKVKRRARRLVGLATSGEPPLIVQAHAPGALVLRTVACRDGRVLDGITFTAERLDPPLTGSSTLLRRIDHAEIDAAASLLVESLGCSGFVSFDFLASPDGPSYLIELNARTVGSGHLGARFGHDIYGRWLAQFHGASAKDPRPSRIDPTRPIALFPKEMQRDPASACLSADAAYLHDVPWDEPRVIAAYRDRLTRQHPAQADLIARRLEEGSASEFSRTRDDRAAGGDEFCETETSSEPHRRSVPTHASIG